MRPPRARGHPCHALAAALAIGAACAASRGAAAIPIETAWSLEEQSWELEGGDGKAHMRQRCVPLWIHARPHPALETWVTAVVASSRLSRRAEGRLDGPDAVRLEVDWRPAVEGLRVFAGIASPAPGPDLTEGDRILATYLGEPVLGWTVPVYGHGWDLRLGGLYGRSLGPGAGTLSLSWQRRGAYDAGFEGDYDPGSDVSLAAGYHLGLATLDAQGLVGWTSGNDHRLAGHTILSTGSRWDAAVRVGGRWRGVLVQGNAAVRAYSRTESYALPGEILPVDSGHLWLAALGLGRPLGSWSARAGLEFVSSPDAPTGRNGGHVWRLEAEILRPIGSSLALGLSLGPSWGELDNGGDASGWRMRLTIFYRAG